MTQIFDEALVVANQEETADVQRLQSILNAESKLSLVNLNGESFRLPESLALILRQSARFLAQGEAVAVLSTEAMLTLHEAAEFLNISLSFLNLLLERQELKATNVDTQPYIHLSALLEYKNEREKKERTGLDEITRLSQEMGLYDL